MGNTASSGGSSRRSHRRHLPRHPPQSQITGNEYVYATPASHSSRYPNTITHGGVRPSPITENLVDRQVPCGPVSPPLAPFVEHDKTVTIRNSVNIKKETLRIEPDQHNPGNFLVAFTFDATTPGRKFVYAAY